MKWNITRKRLLVLAAILAFVALCLVFQGCTKRDEANAKKVGGTVVGLFGMPPIVGESLVALVLAASHAASAKLGERRGRRKERACHIPKAAP